MTGTLLILGHGYSADALSRRLLPLGWTVIGTTRRTDKAERLAARGIEPLIWPGAPLAPALARATHLLAGIGPDGAGDRILLAHLADIAAAAPHLRWAGYLSTTGVYGNHRGAWVDEETPLTPTTDRGRWRVAAEAAWQTLSDQTGLPLHIFRLAGIYGPGRGPFEKVRNGTARLIIKPDQFISRIHVDDIAAILQASMTQPQPGAVYNVCDDDPAPPEDVLRHAARLLGLPAPPEVDFATADMTAMARSFYSESKKVSNRRVKAALGLRLLYPTYREGLAALLAAAGR